MTTVFVSHSSQDREFVERYLIPFLTAHGVRTWYCKESIASGSHWERAIRDGLESSDWFLVVISPRALQSEWVRCEVDWAFDHRAQHLIPLVIEQCSTDDLHLRLRLLQRVDWTGNG